VQRIEHAGGVDLLHEDCAELDLAAMADTPVLRASVPFMLTRETKRRLRSMGYSDDDIAHLTPRQAHEILTQEGRQPNA
jgi:hypothetical protein